MLTDVSMLPKDMFNLCSMQIPSSLIEKYNVPVPRYTSYPTLPLWEDNIYSSSQWLQIVKQTFDESNEKEGISLYIHLPYCESLCTYCACNTRITKNHKVELPYIESVLQEWDMYLSAFKGTPVIRELHLGGGTPTFFSAGSLAKLVKGILGPARRHPSFAFSFEGHPNNTRYDHLKTLYELGATRVSYGVQDLDMKVQTVINRVQPYENVLRATQDARSIGYSSVNFDLVYGLPFQSVAGVKDMVQRVISLRPERIAFYSYAHVPWKRPGQRAYTESDLPADGLKRDLYEAGKELLLGSGYTDVGMDHFALPGDALHTAFHRKTMHRNFMGYTEASTRLLVGLGASAISDAHYGYFQNRKKVEEYQATIQKGELPLLKSHRLSKEDLQIRAALLDIACKGECQWNSVVTDPSSLQTLNVMAEEGLIELKDNGFQVTVLGMAFLRNICSVFDRRMKSSPKTQGPVFSKAI